MGVRCTFKQIFRFDHFVDKIKELATELERRAREQDVMGHTITLEFRTYRFTEISKSLSFPNCLRYSNQFFKYGV